MAIKTRNFDEARRQASTNWELIWWVFMRVSGLLLILLLWMHIYIGPKLISIKAYDYTLLALALLHGTNGSRYILDDYVHNGSLRVILKSTLYVLVAVLLLAGGLFVAKL